jgi:RNA polymerase sigma-70 factor, ECF subfamily
MEFVLSFKVGHYHKMEESNAYFSQIYEAHVEKIYRFIFLKVSSAETAEDLSSEVFLRLLKHIQGPSSEIENPQAFLYQIARSVVADHYRQARVRTISIEKTTFEIEDIEDATRESAETSLEMERISKALVELNDDYQNYVIWRYIDELSVPEIAQITGKTEENVRVGIHRALQALKEKV